MIVVERSKDTRIPVRSRLISINGHLVTDFLEFDFYNDVTRTRKLVLELDNRTRHITYNPEEKIPVTFQSPVYHTCNNACDFCFIRGLPPGLRTKLYVRDDDYRLSFLFGNYLSLTNLTDEDIERIGRLRLSPLYVSVHTTEPELRVRMFKNECAGEIMDQLRSLIEHRIQIHCQIVVVPGINDGVFLEKSISELSSLFPGVLSIGVIPVGRTQYVPDIPLVRPEQAREMVDLIDRKQKQFRDLYGTGLVYAADELYILAGLAIPPAHYYDDTPQIENGIGMVRSFLDEIAIVRGRKKIQGRVLFVTSCYAESFVTVLQKRLIQQDLIKDKNIQTVLVTNEFFGRTITVSGLLSARDIDRAITQQARQHDRIVLPPNCLNDENEFIDSGRISMDTFIAPGSVKELVQWLQS